MKIKNYILVNFQNKLYLLFKTICKFLKGKDYFLGKKISVIDLYMTFFISLIFKHPLKIKLLEQFLKENAPNLDNLVTSLSQNDLKEYYSTYFLINSPL